MPDLITARLVTIQKYPHDRQYSQASAGTAMRRAFVWGTLCAAMRNPMASAAHPAVDTGSAGDGGPFGAPALQAGISPLRASRSHWLRLPRGAPDVRSGHAEVMAVLTGQLMCVLLLSGLLFRCAAVVAAMLVAARVQTRRVERGLKTHPWPSP